MKKTALVTGGTKNQFPAMAVLALNLKDKCPNIADELVIFHDGILESEQKKVQIIFPTRFILYSSPFMKSKDFHPVVKNYFTLMVFCKYECWNLLDEYSSVVWTDYDIVITHDISELFDKTSNCAKFQNTPNIAKKLYPQIYEKEIVKKIDIHGDGISCSLFYLNDTFPDYKNFYNECICLTEKIANALYLPEEAIISILLQQKNIKYDLLDGITYDTQPQKHNSTDKTKILHAAGQPKFWNGLNNEQWNEYYKIWLSDYNGEQFSSQKKSNLILRILKCFLPYGFIAVCRILKQKQNNKAK